MREKESLFWFLSALSVYQGNWRHILNESVSGIGYTSLGEERAACVPFPLSSHRRGYAGHLTVCSQRHTSHAHWDGVEGASALALASAISTIPQYHLLNFESTILAAENRWTWPIIPQRTADTMVAPKGPLPDHAARERVGAATTRWPTMPPAMAGGVDGGIRHGLDIKRGTAAELYANISPQLQILRTSRAEMEVS